MTDELRDLRASVPADFRFPPERSAVSVREIADKLAVSVKQVIRILNRDRAQAINISVHGAGTDIVRAHHRIPISAYYAVAAKRIAVLEDPDAEGAKLPGLEDFL